MPSFLAKLLKRNKPSIPEQVSPTQEFNTRVVELVLAIGTAKNLDEARKRVYERAELFIDRCFLPAFIEFRNVIKSSPDCPEDIDNVLGTTLRLASEFLWNVPPAQLDCSGFCTLWLLAGAEPEYVKKLAMRVGTMIDHIDVITHEFEQIAQEFTTRGLGEYAEWARQSIQPIAVIGDISEIIFSESIDNLYQSVEKYHARWNNQFFEMAEQGIQLVSGNAPTVGETFYEKLQLAHLLKTRVEFVELTKQIVLSEDLGFALDAIIDFCADSNPRLVNALDTLRNQPAMLFSAPEAEPLILSIVDLTKQACELQLQGLERDALMRKLQGNTRALQEFFAVKVVGEVGKESLEIFAAFMDCLDGDAFCRVFWSNLPRLSGQFVICLDKLVKLADLEESPRDPYSIERRTEALRKAITISPDQPREVVELMLKQYILLDLIINGRIGQEGIIEQAAIFNDQFTAMLSEELERYTQCGDSTVQKYLEQIQELVNDVRNAMQNGAKASDLVWQVRVEKSFKLCNFLFTKLLDILPDRITPLSIFKIYLAAFFITGEDKAVNWVTEHSEAWRFVSQASSGEKSNLLDGKQYLDKLLLDTDMPISERVQLLTFRCLINLSLVNRSECYDDLVRLQHAASAESSERLLETMALAFTVMSYASFSHLQYEPAQPFVVGEITRAFSRIATEADDELKISVARHGISTIQILNTLDFMGRNLYGGDLVQYYRNVDRALDDAREMEGFTRGSWPLVRWVEQMVSPRGTT